MCSDDALLFESRLNRSDLFSREPQVSASKESRIMPTDFLKISPKITVLPIIHGSGDFAIEVRRVMLSERFDCLAVPLPPSFQENVEQAIEFLPSITAVVQKEQQQP